MVSMTIMGFEILWLCCDIYLY